MSHKPRDNSLSCGESMRQPQKNFIRFSLYLVSFILYHTHKSEECGGISVAKACDSHKKNLVSIFKELERLCFVSLTSQETTAFHVAKEQRQPQKNFIRFSLYLVSFILYHTHKSEECGWISAPKACDRCKNTFQYYLFAIIRSYHFLSKHCSSHYLLNHVY